MDDLRSEIRAAFEKEQAGHAPSGAMRGQVVEAVVSGSRPSRNFQWVAVVAAVLLGVAVVVGLMATRNAHRASVPATTPKASVADYGPPPPGVQLLYVHDPEHASWLIGYDWSGNPRATVKLDPSKTTVQMAPDGKSFAVGYGAKGGTGEILDRLGQPVEGSGAISSYSQPAWADDNVHICGVSYVAQQSEWALVTVAPGEAVKSVPTAIDPQGTIVRSGIIGVGVAGCSIRANQAVITRTPMTSISDLWVVRISDGAILTHYPYPNPQLLANVVVSRDAALIAENSSKSNSQLGPNAPNTIVRRVSDRSVVATLDPSMGVLAFNSDDSLALVTTTPWVGGQPTALAVIDLKSGRVIWNYTGTGMFGNAVAQPGGRDFALYVRKPTVEDPLTDLMIVHADGRATEFPRRYAPAW